MLDGRALRRVALLDRDPGRPRAGAALLVQGRVGVMVNEEDHLRLHGMWSGFDLEDAYAEVEAVVRPVYDAAVASRDEFTRGGAAGAEQRPAGARHLIGRRARRLGAADARARDEADSVAKRWAAGVEYLGTRYSGWQWQGHAPSVQQEIERVLATVADHPVKVTAAGRTDAGVHALNQVVHFDSDAPRAPHAWLFGGNSQLPRDIGLRWVQDVDVPEPVW